MYIKYKIPYAANSIRGSNGTIPIGIDGGFFSQLMVAAPELKESGIWLQFGLSCLTVLLSGMRADLVLAALLSSTEYPEEAWKFIQWWSSDEVQTQYEPEVEATFDLLPDGIRQTLKH